MFLEAYAFTVDAVPFLLRPVNRRPDFQTQVRPQHFHEVKSDIAGRWRQKWANVSVELKDLQISVYDKSGRRELL
jgi:hypothetical protein